MKPQIVLALLLAVFPFSSPFAQRAARDNAASGKWDVQWMQQSLSVTTHAAPLADVMHGIAEKTGLVVYGDHWLKGETAANFSNLRLQDALAILLRSFNYALQEPAALNNFHYVLSIVSSRSDAGAIQSASPENTSSAAPLLPAYEGYIPEQYHYLYDSAKRGDVDRLRQAASSGDETTQALALKLLARQYPGEATRIAAEAVASPDPNRKLNAVQSLGELDSAEAAKALGQALQDADTVVRQAAVLGLQGQTSPEAIALLSEALRDKEGAIRMLALDILAERGAGGADGVKEALQSDDPDLRNHAHELLERLAVVK